MASKAKKVKGLGVLGSAVEYKPVTQLPVSKTQARCFTVGERVTVTFTGEVTGIRRIGPWDKDRYEVEIVVEKMEG